jgi:DNA polymerase delta subunit 2
MLVTGCIVAVMGTENANGDFEIIDLRVPDLPRQPQRWERDDAQLILANGRKTSKAKGQEKRTGGGKVAIVSGLGVSGDHADTMAMDLLMEYLLGEAGGTTDQADAGKISRLVIAGNSIYESTPSTAPDDLPDRKAGKKYGYDSSAYNPAPTTHFDYFLLNLLPSIPITLLPGETDPANVSLPQQPIHPAMFQHSRRYAALPGADEPGWLDCVTNPWEGDINGWRMMGNGGQPIDDIFKYVEGDDRLEMMEHLLRWRCAAPTAPDTLCKLIHRLVPSPSQLPQRLLA